MEQLEPKAERPANKSLEMPKRRSKRLETILAEGRLIRLVRQQPVLYNAKNPHFKDEALKEKIWKKIARESSLEVTQCMSIWAELRYKYQNYVRRLRVYDRQRIRQKHQERLLLRRREQQRLGEQPDHHGGQADEGEQQQKKKPRLKRPTMLHEVDLVFLYEHVASQPLHRSEKKNKKRKQLEQQDEDEVTIITTPTVIIDLDAEQYSEEYNINDEQLRLIAAVSAYPQLYDPHHKSYQNYRHRGLIWSAISNELHEKATKLMKTWLQLQTRYEWEMKNEGNWNTPSQLQRELSFLEPHLPSTPGTVCKLSLYMQEHSMWFDPIEHFRTVFNIINVLKCSPELQLLLNDYLPQTPRRYHALWERVGSQVHCSKQRCEITWLLLRNFYLELSEMRKVGYQLQDKWFFENIIGGMYKLVARRVQLQPRYPSSQSQTPAPTLPIAKVHPTATAVKGAATAPAKAPASAPVTAVKAAAANVPASAPATGLKAAATAAAKLAASPPATTVKAAAVKVPTSAPATAVRAAATAAVKVPGSAPATVARQAAAIAAPPAAPKAVSNVSLSKPLPLPIPAAVQLANIARNGVQVEVMRTSKPKLTIAARSQKTLLPSAASTSATMQAIKPAMLKTPQIVNVQSMATGVLLPPLKPAPAATATGADPPALAAGITIEPVTPIQMPKLVPLTVRNDKVAMPSGIHLMPTLRHMGLPLKRNPAPSSTQPQSKMHRNTLHSGWIELQAATSSHNSRPSTSTSTIVRPKSPPPFNNLKVQFHADHPSELNIFGTTPPTQIHMNMSRTALFIREVMAVPQLHSTEPHLLAKVDELWFQLSKKFHMSECACRVTWAFLSNNMSLFPQIAPMQELMRPFKTTLRVWEKSHRLFSKFDEIARKYQWMVHKDKLPALMQLFKNYEHLYWELRKPRPGESTYPIRPPRIYTEKERSEVWRLAREQFPQMNHRDIWSMFKFAFTTYMEDLERGIENPWPQNWWHALEQLKFLVNVRYHPLEPYYYIVHNKFMEEVKRCSMYEALMQPTAESVNNTVPSTTNKKMLMAWETEEAKKLLTGKPHEIVSPKEPQKEPPKAQEQTQQQEPEVVEQQKEAVEPANAMVKHIRNENRLLPQHLPPINPYQLTRTLRSHPYTYGNATTADKRSAWVRVAKDLNATVSDCRLSLQHALRQQRRCALRDPKSRCTMSQKYFRHMAHIYKEVRIGKFMEVDKVPIESPDLIHPESFVPDINTLTSKPSVVLKNWAFALGKLPRASQEELQPRLENIFKKYAAAAQVEVPVELNANNNGNDGALPDPSSETDNSCKSVKIENDS